MTQSAKKKIVAIYSSDPEYFACPYIRIWSPLSVSSQFNAISGCSIDAKGIKCSTNPATLADLVILQRDFPLHTEAVEKILAIT